MGPGPRVYKPHTKEDPIKAAPTKVIRVIGERPPPVEAGDFLVYRERERPVISVIKKRAQETTTWEITLDLANAA